MSKRKMQLGLVDAIQSLCRDPFIVAVHVTGSHTILTNSNITIDQAGALKAKPLLEAVNRRMDLIREIAETLQRSFE